MTLRGRIVVWTAAVLLALFAVVVLGVLAVTGTARGREQIRSVVVSALRSRVHGKLYVGHITEGFFTGVTIDSIAIRDASDTLFLSTGRVHVAYDLRDLFDRRFLLRGIEVEHPYVYMKQHEDGRWNFREIFTSTSQPSGPQGAAAFVVVDSALVRNATFVLTLPWHPSPHLHGAARDSAIRFELTRQDHEIRRNREGFTRTWRWSGGNAFLVHGRISHPDTAGSQFVFREVRVREADPPFLFRNVSGTMRQLGDSIWVRVPHFDLPGTTGEGAGKIVWGSDLPVRYDVRVHGDSVSLADVNWVYPTLPTTGGGTTDLAIQTDPKDLRLTNFVLTRMDVRSTRSHLLGRMTFVIGTDTLSVKDVQLVAAPVNFDLLRTLNGKPFPYNWQGNLSGTVRASGGNLARFRVEDAQVQFADANVPGAVSTGTAHGELDILYPAYTAFHGFAVNATSVDLRTFQALNRNFPRLNGTISGTAVLDSSWLDVRFRDAQLTHQDGPGPASHVSGNGRVTWGDKYLTYDLDLQTAPLAFETLARSYPRVPIRSAMSGPLRVVGESPDLRVTTTLQGPGGTLTYDGRVDADPPSYGASGTGTTTALDLRTLLANPALPRTSLNGAYTLDISGDTLPDLTGSISLALAASTVGSSPLSPSVARVHFGDGLMAIDTLALASGSIAVNAHGALATASERSGTLDYRVTVGSFADVTRLLDLGAPPPVHGPVTFSGQLTGSLDHQAVTGTASATDFAAAGAQISRLAATYDLSGLPAAVHGTASVTVDSLTAGILPIAHARLDAQIADASHARVAVQFTGAGDVTGGALASLVHDTAATAVTVDSASVTVDTAERYRLTAPARVVVTTRAVTTDSIILARSRGGVLAMRGLALAGDSVRGAIRASGFDLGIVDLFTSALRLGGTLNASVDLAGTTAQPRLFGSVTVANGSAGVPSTGGRFDNITADVALRGDTVLVQRLAAVTNGERRGTLDITGAIGIGHYSDPAFDLSATARNFRAIDRRGVATLDITTARPITLRGPLTDAIVSGAITVDRGTVYIPEVIRKRVVDLNDPELVDIVDTTIAANRTVLPHAPPALLQGLRLQDVRVNVGDDVWLRSEEANIKLGGALNVALGRAVGSDRAQLALEGELSAVRGTYRLNVVPFVQPTFDVEQGTLRFFGTPDLDPALDITAINTVRAPQQSLNGQDVRIRATIGGTLSSPTLTLSSADNLPLSQSDLLSYLITGQPAFALDYTNQQYVNQLAAVAVRSAGNIISAAIPHSLFDVVELQTPTTVLQDVPGTNGATSLYNLLNTRAVLGKQLNNSLFLNFTTGFCTENFYRNLGLRLEYRFGRTYSAQFGLEPGSSELVCARAGTVPAAQQTPPQLGIDFLRAWRF